MIVRVVKVTVLALAITAIVRSIPDIKRYLEIRQM
jgi:hypothetical protein